MDFLALILKKFLYFLKRKLFIYFLKRKLFLYFLIFQETKTSKQIFIFQETEALKSFLYFRKYNFLSPSPKNKTINSEMRLSDSKIKKFLIFPEMELALLNPSSKIKKIHPKKISYVSGNRSHEKNFLYVLKRKLFLYFTKQEPRKNSLCFRNFC